MEPSTLKKYTTEVYVLQSDLKNIPIVIYTSFAIGGIKMFIKDEPVKLNWKENKYVY